MNAQTTCILFSILLVPVNLLCTHWMTQEAVHLTGMTYMEFLKTTSGVNPTSVRRKQNWWYYVNFFNEHSTDPEKSIRFMWMQVAAALPSVAAMYFLTRVYASPNRVSFAMTGNCMIMAKAVQLAADGNLKAAEFIRDTLGENPQYKIYKKKLEYLIADKEAAHTLTDEWVASIPEWTE